MLDRDYYQEQWLRNVLGVDPKKRRDSRDDAVDTLPGSGQALTHPREMGRPGERDPRLQAVYRQHRENAKAWRQFWLTLASWGVFIVTLIVW